jgi:hypothetical protein
MTIAEQFAAASDVFDRFQAQRLMCCIYDKFAGPDAKHHNCLGCNFDDLTEQISKYLRMGMLIRRDFIRQVRRNIIWVVERYLRTFCEESQRHCSTTRPNLCRGFTTRFGAELLRDRPGRSAIRFTASSGETISREQGEPILRVLESIERDHGYQTKFAGRQVNFLVMSWRRFAEAQQLPP